MPIPLTGLDPEFTDRLKAALADNADRGATMVPYFGIRTAQEQAKLWRQSRSVQQIADRVADLRARGADFLATCIESVGPQHGPPVTNAIPGYSWHQWGEAMDCYWLRDGKAEWSPDVGGAKNGYRVFAEVATQHGLTAGGYWQSIKDWPHVQKRRASSPGDAGLVLAAINARMRALYG